MKSMSRDQVIRHVASKVTIATQKNSSENKSLTIGPFLVSDFDPVFMSSPEVILPELLKKCASFGVSRFTTRTTFAGMVDDVSYNNTYITAIFSE